MVLVPNREYIFLRDALVEAVQAVYALEDFVEVRDVRFGTADRGRIYWRFNAVEEFGNTQPPNWTPGTIRARNLAAVITEYTEYVEKRAEMQTLTEVAQETAALNGE